MIHDEPAITYMFTVADADKLRQVIEPILSPVSRASANDVQTCVYKYWDAPQDKTDLSGRETIEIRGIRPATQSPPEPGQPYMRAFDYNYALDSRFGTLAARIAPAELKDQTGEPLIATRADITQCMLELDGCDLRMKIVRLAEMEKTVVMVQAAKGKSYNRFMLEHSGTLELASAVKNYAERSEETLAEFVANSLQNNLLTPLCALPVTQARPHFD